MIGAAGSRWPRWAVRVAPTVGMLIAARVAAGRRRRRCSRRAAWPSSRRRSIRADRGRAIGAWSGLGGVATAIGPFLGGWLVDAASWRWIFLLNVPRRHRRHHGRVAPRAREPRPDATGRVDCARRRARRARPRRADARPQRAALAGAAVIGARRLLVAFVVIERRTRHPLVPLAIFRSRTFSGTNVVTLLLYGALGVVFFLLGWCCRARSGYTPLQAGAATMPVTLAMLALSARAGALAQRIGPRIPMTVGPLLVATSMLCSPASTADSTYVTGSCPASSCSGSASR